MPTAHSSDSVVPNTSSTATADDAPRPGARLALTLLLAINLFNYIDRSILSSVEPEIRQFLKDNAMAAGHPIDDGVAKGMTGWLPTAFLISYMLIAPIFGWLADQMSRYLLVGMGVAVWSLASGATGMAVTFGMILVTRVFIGVGEAAYGPSAPTILSDLYPVRRRGAILAWFYMAIPVGSAIGYAFGGLFTHGAALSGFHGWRGAFYAVVPPGLALAAFCFFMKDPPRGQADDTQPHTKSSCKEVNQSDARYCRRCGRPLGPVCSRKANFHDYLTMFKTPSYLLNTAGMAAMSFAIGGIQYWMPAYLSEERHAGSLESIGLKFGAICASAGILATLLGGIAGDRLRKRWGGAYFIVSAFGIFLSTIFIVLMLYTPFPFAWVWLFMAVFWLFFNTGPSNTILANVVHPSMRSTGFAINILLIHALGDVPAPPIMGPMSHYFGWNMTFYLVCFTMVLGGLFWMWGTRFLARDTELAPRRLDPH